MLYIKTDSNNVIGHPVTLENLILVYPDFKEKSNNYGYVPFVKANTIPATPSIQPYLKVESTYRLKGGKCFETFLISEMTDEEKQKKIQSLLLRKPHDSWILNEITCIFEPPIPYPNDENKYEWDEAAGTWVII